MRVVHYNVKRLSLLGQVAATVGALRPDVLTLNEVEVGPRCPSALADLAAAVGLREVHFFGHVRGTYGNAVLSRSPAKRLADVCLNGGTTVSHEGRPYRIGRGAVVCEFRHPGLVVACTHLDHMAEAERATQMTHLLRVLGPHRDRGATVLIAGDLNALDRADYRDYEWACNAANGWPIPQQGYHDASLLAPGSSRHFTSPAGAATQRIDFIFTSKALGVKCAQVEADAIGSDHLPLAVTLENDLTRTTPR